MKKNKKNRVYLGRNLFILTFIFSFVAIQTQRIRYLAYLHHQGISTFKLFVPVDVWLPFHYNALSITLDIISLLPFLLLATGWIWALNKT